MIPGVTFRKMTQPDVTLALDWAAAEGWNPGIDDAPAFYATDQNGFFLAERDGTPVAAISVVNHSDSLAFLGLYLCLPQYRGQGIGYALWQHALEHAGDRVVGLDGVPDQQANYKKSGFELTGQTYRFAGQLKGQASSALRPLVQADLTAISDMDTLANGYAKHGFLQHWTKDTATRRSLVLGDTPRGFATIRACRSGHKIGPVIAETMDDAERLVRGLIDLVDAQEVTIDVPDDCAPLMAFCESHGFVVSFNTARMYRGAAPSSGPLLRSIATMELG